MQEKTCCFTGHRELPEEQLPQLKQALFKVIVRLASQGVHALPAAVLWASTPSPHRWF